MYTLLMCIPSSDLFPPLYGHKSPIDSLNGVVVGVNVFYVQKCRQMMPLTMMSLSVMVYCMVLIILSVSIHQIAHLLIQTCSGYCSSMWVLYFITCYILVV